MKESKVIDVTHHELSTCDSLKKKWVRIVYDGIITNYEINRDGFVRNINTKKRLKEEISNRGYRRVIIMVNKKHRKISLHRTLASIFIKIPKSFTKRGYTQKSLEVNHINGDKLDCELSNLEWNTPKENTQHAFLTGLAFVSIGDKSHLSKINNDTAILICELLSKGKDINFISETLNVSKSTIRHIRNRECWNSISKKYTFPTIDTIKPFTISDKDIHKICKLLEMKKYTDLEIANKYGISRGYVNDIKLHRRRLDISCLYKF